jgi:hypothetical protein
MDVAKIMELYQKGITAINSIFLKKLLMILIRVICAAGNRRGLGFDKPQLGAEGPTCGCASMTFGHISGTMAWADAETQIVYVFLSNENFSVATEINYQNIREDIQNYLRLVISSKLILF